jgi:dethiobiotin synthetase
MPAEYPCPALFVTGTDTGVGKTLVTAALARFLTNAGLSVGVMKPIETGVRDTSVPGDDAALLRWAACSEDPDEQIAPYRFVPPVAPAQAVEESGAHIDPGHIAKLLVSMRCRKDIVLVEGAGGLMVPIQGGFLMADLAGHLELPLLLVTHPRLGTLNHTLLTTFVARAMDLQMAGYLINRMPTAPTKAEAETPHQLAALASADLLGVLPEIEDGSRQQVTRLAEEIGRLPTLVWLINALGLAGRFSI